MDDQEKKTLVLNGRQFGRVSAKLLSFRSYLVGLEDEADAATQTAIRDIRTAFDQMFTLMDVEAARSFWDRLEERNEIKADWSPVEFKSLYMGEWESAYSSEDIKRVQEAIHAGFNRLWGLDRPRGWASDNLVKRPKGLSEADEYSRLFDLALNAYSDEDFGQTWVVNNNKREWTRKMDEEIERFLAKGAEAHALAHPYEWSAPRLRAWAKEQGLIYPVKDESEGEE